MQRVKSWLPNVPLLCLGLAASVHAVTMPDASLNLGSVVAVAQSQGPQPTATPDMPALTLRDAAVDDSARYFRRPFAALRPAKTVQTGPEPSSITTSAIPDRRKPDRIIMIADADTNYARWQKNADEKLRQESDIRTVKEHPLATANPDSYVTVCEAGCRGAPDQIVYSVIKTEAASAAGRGYVPTGATGADEAQSSDETTRAVPVAIGSVEDQSSIMCVAGCYESPKVHRARPVAGTGTTEPSRKPVTAGNLQLRAPQLTHNGAIVEARTGATRAASVKAITRAISARLTAKSAWRAKVFRSTRGQAAKSMYAVPAQARPAQMTNAAPKARPRHFALKAKRHSKSISVARVAARTRR